MASYTYTSSPNTFWFGEQKENESARLVYAPAHVSGKLAHYLDSLLQSVWVRCGGG